MTDYNDTSNWEKKNPSTILYRYQHEGKQHEGKLELDPHRLHVQVENLSIREITHWAFADEKQPDSTTGYRAYEYIKIDGKLDLAKVHVFTLGKGQTVIFNRIDVSVYPLPLEKLQASSKHERWSGIGSKERPEEGWLKDEPGRIDFNEANEYFDKSSISARLWLDQATFDATVQKIKNGGTIRNARLEILADLFQFGYEGAFAPPMATRNYGLLCESEGRSGRAHTNARLEELMLEWSPRLARPLPDVTLDHLPSETTNDDTSGRAVSGLASDVKQIRARLDVFYQAAIAVVVFLVITNVLGWFS